MKRNFLSIIFLAAFMAVPVFAERATMPAFTMPTAASSGFGGTHVAYTDNVFALLVNPAAMTRVQQRSFFTLSASLFSPQSTTEISESVIDMISSGNTTSFGNMADTLNRHRGRIALGFELRELPPFSIAWVANGFGFGLWSHSFVKAEVIGGTVRATAYSDIMLPIGFAFRILDLNAHSVDAGFTIKPFVRVMARERASILDLIDNNDFEFSIPVIWGGGLDIGFLYRWDGGFQAGLTFTDILSRGTSAENLGDAADTINDYYVPFAINAGISKSFRFAEFLGVTFAADWRDIGNAFNQTDYLNNRNFLLDFGAGVQVSLFDIFFLRAGMNEMLPAAGLGIRLGALQIDAAYYGREFGYEPGQLSTAVVDLSVSIRPGAKERNWGWTRNSAFGLFGIGN